MWLPKVRHGYVKQPTPTFTALTAPVIGSWPHHGSMPIPDRDKPRPLIRGLPPGRAMIDRAVVHVDDMFSPEAQAEFPEAWKFTQAVGLRTMLVAPLLREGVAIGAIFIRRTEVRPFTGQADRIARNLRRSSGHRHRKRPAVQRTRTRNRQLTEAWSSRRRRARFLRVIASSPTDIEPVLKVVAENAARLCDSSDAQIFRVEGDMVRKVASYGVTAPVLGVGETRPISRGSGESVALSSTGSPSTSTTA